MTALFHQEGGLLVPSQLTRGGWDNDTQHGGPPAGIMARAVEAVPTVTPMQVTRFTVDLVRPVPLTPLRVETAISRDGGRIQTVEVTLWSDEVEVGRARALKIRVGELDLPAPETDLMPLAPEDMETLEWDGHFGDGTDLPRFHYDAVETRTDGRSFALPGPGTSWFRLRHPLIEGEPNTPFVLAATLADMGNGNSQVLDFRRHVFINPDISLHLHRLPRGEWVGMKSVSHAHPHGVGMADSLLFDREGRIGRVIQSQFIANRD